MYRAIEIVPSDRDYHRFLWRRHPQEPLVDYRMTRLTFGVSASLFAANMSVVQNASDFAKAHPLAYHTIKKSLYVDDCLTGACGQCGGSGSVTGSFTATVWKGPISSSQMEFIASSRTRTCTLIQSHVSQALPDGSDYHKTLGIEWSTGRDLLRLAVFTGPNGKTVTKRLVTSEIARTFDILGFFAPSTIKAKILLQRIRETVVGWDEAVPSEIRRTYQRWRVELSILSNKVVPRRYFPCRPISQVQLHGFSDASEEAYSSVVYLRVQAPDDSIHVSLVMSKTRVSPLKRLSIPRLELSLIKGTLLCPTNTGILLL